MISDHDPREIIQRLVRWGEREKPVRAMLLTSTRTKPNATLDIFSDYDVVVVVEDILPYFEGRSWLENFGEVLVAYRDPIRPDPEHGIERTSNVTQYSDGLKIDFTLWPVTLARRISEADRLSPDLDDGYSVLLDKDSLLDEMPSPGYEAYVPERPTEEDYLTTVNDFFSDAPYVAKNLWRDELLPAKWSLDFVMKQKYLRRMLEWRMEQEYHWQAPTGNLGKGLKRRLPVGIWADFENTFVGAGIPENWEALFQTMALFRRVATDVADDLGYTYPLELDRRVTAYTRAVKQLESKPADDPEL